MLIKMGQPKPLEFNFENSYEKEKYGLKGLLAYTLRHYNVQHNYEMPAQEGSISDFAIKPEQENLSVSYETYTHPSKDHSREASVQRLFSGWGYEMRQTETSQLSIGFDKTNPGTNRQHKMTAQTKESPLQFLFDHLKQNAPALAKYHRLQGMTSLLLHIGQAQGEEGETIAFGLAKNSPDDRSWFQKKIVAPFQKKQDAPRLFLCVDQDVALLREFVETALDQVGADPSEKQNFYRGVTGKLLENSVTSDVLRTSNHARAMHADHCARQEQAVTLDDQKKLAWDVIRYENNLRKLINN